MSDRLIYVVGTPSGGTSVVAGALHHLGVNMGICPPQAGIRGYTTYEDLSTHGFKVTPDGDEEIVVRQRLRLREYIAFRLENRTGDERIGVKGSALWWIDQPSPGKLPIDIIRVKRPLEHAIWSDWRIQQRIAEDRPDMRDPLTTERKLARARAVASTWAGAEELCRLITPVLTLDFSLVLDSPHTAVTALCIAARINPPDDVVERAVAFIDPEKRHF